MYTNTDPYTEINCSKSICLLLLRQFHSDFYYVYQSAELFVAIYPFCHLKFKDPFAPFHFSHRSIWVSVTVFGLYDYVVCGQGEVTCVWYQNGMSWWHLHVCTRPRYCRITYNVTGKLVLCSYNMRKLWRYIISEFFIFCIFFTSNN